MRYMTRKYPSSSAEDPLCYASNHLSWFENSQAVEVASETRWDQRGFTEAPTKLIGTG